MTDTCPLATAYEQLRRQVLLGDRAGSPMGLIVLLREGMAGWASHRPHQTPADCGDQLLHDDSWRTTTIAMPEDAGPLRTAVIHVLANMIAPTLAIAMESSL